MKSEQIKKNEELIDDVIEVLQRIILEEYAKKEEQNGE